MPSYIERGSEILERRARLREESLALVPAEGEMSAEARERFEAIDVEVATMTTELRALERAHQEELEARRHAEAVADAERRSQRGLRAVPTDEDLSGGDDEEAEARTAAVLTDADRMEARSAFAAGDPARAPASARELFVSSSQLRALSESPGFPDEARSILAATDRSLGYLIGEEDRAPLDRARRAFGGLKNICTVRQTSHGRSTPYPSIDDTENKGRRIGEGNAVSSAVDPAGKVVRGHVYSYTSDVLQVSFEFLQDDTESLFGEGEIFEALGMRIERIVGEEILTYNGPDGPMGLMPRVGQGHETAASGAIGYDDYVDLEASVDRAYRAQGSWLLSDTAETAARKIKTLDDVPLWQNGMTFGKPDQILGKPYAVDVGMDAVAAGKFPVAYGQFDTYVARDVVPPLAIRLNELYATSGMVGFLIISRHGGVWRDPAKKGASNQSIKKMKVKA